MYARKSRFDSKIYDGGLHRIVVTNTFASDYIVMWMFLVYLRLKNDAPAALNA